MSGIRELSFDEIAQVSGGGNAGDHDCSNSGRSSSGSSKGSSGIGHDIGSAIGGALNRCAE